MKKTLSIFLALVLTVALCACGAKTPVQPSAQPSMTPTATPVQTDLTTYLTSINTDYEQGVAGCSLRAAKIAGEMLDWYVAKKPSAASITSETASFFTTLGSATADFTSKLADIYGSAMLTCGSDGADLLSSAGYTPQGTWTADDAKTLFEAVYAGAQLPTPTYIAVYSSDKQAERFVINYVSVDELTADNVLAALINAEVLKDTVKVENFNSGKTLKLDLNSDFQTGLSAMGTSGEYMMLGSVVNTFLKAFGADSITITVNGKTLETGHNVYTDPLTLYADNVAKG